MVEGGEFRILGSLRKYREALAGPGFNESRNKQPVENLEWFSFSHQQTETVRIGVLVDAIEAAAAANENARDLSQVSGFIASDSGHGLDPAGHPIAGPAGHQFHGVVGGLLFEENMIGEEAQRVGQNTVAPRDGCAGMQG